jgi:hypothetical protein
MESLLGRTSKPADNGQLKVACPTVPAYGKLPWHLHSGITVNFQNQDSRPCREQGETSRYCGVLHWLNVMAESPTICTHNFLHHRGRTRSAIQGCTLNIRVAFICTSHTLIHSPRHHDPRFSLFSGREIVCFTNGTLVFLISRIFLALRMGYDTNRPRLYSRSRRLTRR